MKFILSVNEINQLKYVLEEINIFKSKLYESNTDKLISSIENFIDNL